MPRRGLSVRAARLDEAGDLLRRPGSGNVHEHQEPPHLADVDGGSAAVGAHVAAVGARLDLLDPDPPVQARDGDARLLHGHRQEPADAARERVLDRRLVADEGEGAARGLRDGVHRGGVVIGAEAERVDRRGPAAERGRGRHEVSVGLGAVGPDRRPAAGSVLPVGEEDHACDGVPLPAAGEHLSAHTEPLANVGAPHGTERPHGELRRGLPHVRHAREADLAGGVAREGDDGEAVGRAELVDDEAHGLLQQLQLLALHAEADVEHGDEVERRARHVGRRLGVHEHRESVPGCAPREGRELALRAEDQTAVGRGGLRRGGGRTLQRLVVLVLASRRRRTLGVPHRR